MGNLYAFWIFLISFVTNCLAIKWLGVSKMNLTWRMPQECRYAYKMQTFDRGQVQFCKRYFHTMRYIAKASAETRRTCQTQFMHSRWNCSNIELVPNYMNDLKQGTREQAYVAALSSANIAHILAKACASGALPTCNCGPMPNEAPGGDFKWGGCGDDVVFGAKVSRLFTDVPFNEQFHLSQSKKKEKQAWKKSRLSKAKLVLHNQNAGREIVRASLSRHCKCHGVSGSCQIRTCWKSLPTMKEISDKLYRNYKRAVEVRFQSETGAFRPLYPLVGQQTQETLLFAVKSSDYCNADPQFGSLGTKNRLCNATSSGPDNCQTMCCGRGYYSVTMHVPVRCNCKYIWCCRVECQTCQEWVHITRCK